MEFLTNNWQAGTLILMGILISDVIGMSRLKANSVIQLLGQIFKTLKFLKKN